ncbi:MAG: putative peptide zinc metalloprotease protein [Actinomycetota bacterium]|jgi:putative peptide zinc metalloprotease protein|nr:putative peptide zinc metalloprotease protein [Actinomycetota bacterium]
MVTSTRPRFLVAALLAVLLAFGAPSNALAQSPAPSPSASDDSSTSGSQNPDNVVVKVNKKDGSSVFKLGFKVIKVMGDTVDSGNAAAAVSSCESCRTVVIAISVVLIMSDPSIVAPENLALALNVDCTLCETMALAYQLVLSPGEMARIDHDAGKAIKDLLDQIDEIGSSDLPLAEIDAQVSALVDQLFDIVRNSLVPVGQDDDEEDQADASPTPSPSVTPSESPSPTPSTESTPEPTPSPANETPSPEPTPT